MSKISYICDPDDDSSGFTGLWAWINYWKYLDHDLWPEMSLDDLDRDAVEQAQFRYGIKEPRIIKRLEMDGSADGEVWYLIVEASELPAGVPQSENPTL